MQDKIKQTDTEERTVKIGVLFSQTGPMAISESSHLRGVLLACEEINQNGGIGGLKIEPIILDPAGDDLLYAKMATELLLKHRVNVIFGCCLSSSRKAVLPIVERFNGILFYPSVYEGFEYSPNVIYGGGVPNQLVLPLLKYIFNNYGKKIALIGLDYLYPREINRVVTEFLNASGGKVVAEKYLNFSVDFSNLKSSLNEILKDKPDVIFSTVVGLDSINLFNVYADLDTDGPKPPIASLTAVESSIQALDIDKREGYISVASYFSSLDTNTNKAFIKNFKTKFGENTSPCVFSEVAYSLVHIFADALLSAEFNETESILAALSEVTFNSPGGELFLDLNTNHFTLKPYVAKSNRDGQYDILWESPSFIKPDPYLIAYDRSIEV